jgi:hypothetical protein
MDINLNSVAEAWEEGFESSTRADCVQQGDRSGKTNTKVTSKGTIGH